MFDAKRFIDAEFGGARALFEALSGRPDSPKMDAVYKWHRRNSMPGEALALCLAVLEERDGVPPSVRKYRETKKCRTLSAKPTLTGHTPDIFG